MQYKKQNHVKLDELVDCRKSFGAFPNENNLGIQLWGRND